MIATATAARTLQALPPETACGVLTAVEVAVCQAAQGHCPDGCGTILPGMLWRLERDGLRVSFGLAGGDMVIMALSHEAASAKRRKGR